MIREIYFRDPTDPKYTPNLLETSSKVETVLNKIRMILFTNRGEVLGDPNLGMDLEDYLFQFGLDEHEIRNRFNAQIAQYIPESREFDISLDIKMETNGIENYCYLYIDINSERYLGVQL